MSRMEVSRRAVNAGLLGAMIAPRAAARAAERGEPVETPIAVEDGRVWISARIDDSEPMLFVIDTGGALQLIHADVAARLRLPIVSGSRIGGLGKGGVALGGQVVARNLRFSSGLSQQRTAFVTTDLKLGKDAAGSLAAGLFTAEDSELDFEAGVWRLWRNGRPSFDGMIKVAATITGGNSASSPRIIATVMIDGRPYRLLLDTGASRIILYPRAAARSGLFSDGRPFAPASMSGVAGLTAKPSRIVRANRLELSPLSIERPLIALMDPNQLFKETDHDGLVGLPLLEMLTLATDTRHRALYARRNGRPPAKERYPGSGLWLDNGKGGQAVVALVGTGSPAAEAGMRAGDVIVEPGGWEAAMRAVQQPHVDIGVRAGAGVERRRWTPKPYL